MSPKQVTQQTQLSKSNNGHLEVKHQQQIHQGPLPMATELASYESTLPGAAERILAMAEKQSEHRQKLEVSVVEIQNRNSTIGVWCAFILCLFTIGMGGYGAYNGGGWASALFGSSGIAGLASVFIYGTNKNNPR